MSLSNDQSKKVSPDIEGLVVNPAINFPEAGSLSKIEFIGQRLGEVELMVGWI